MSDSLARVVTKYLETLKFDGICGYMIKTNKNGDGLPKIIININVDYIYGSTFNQGYLVRRIILGVHEELKKIFDLDFPIDYELHEC